VDGRAEVEWTMSGVTSDLIQPCCHHLHPRTSRQRFDGKEAHRASGCEKCYSYAESGGAIVDQEVSTFFLVRDCD
jgi:hypothetical protein